MYISYGTSFKSEQKAYFKAIKMAEKLGIAIHSIRLDKYYSKQIYVKYLADKNKGIKFYLIPQKNSTIKGCLNWKEMLTNFVYNTQFYLSEYFNRNQSERLFLKTKEDLVGKSYKKELTELI